MTREIAVLTGSNDKIGSLVQPSDWDACVEARKIHAALQELLGEALL